jgi:intracellular sulfur oxidation DsrE/DsrF family protein
MKKYVLLAGIILALLSSPAMANPQVDRLLQNEAAPDGIVFEIASGDPGFLDIAIPRIQDYSNRLREKFPDLSITVVTHGREQFALTRDNAKQKNDVHKRVQSLVKDYAISVHVCETYANWNDVAAEAFPDYIDVSAAGPAQINDYRELGYTVIRIRP